MAVVVSVLLTCMGQGALASNLFAIIATDDDAPGIGQDMAKNSKMMISMIKWNVPRSRSQIVKVPARSLTPMAVLRTIQSTGAGADDAVLFFYSGHGAYDETMKQTCLMMSRSPGSVLFVGQVRRVIEEKRVRLATIVVDCCNQLRPLLARGPIAPGEPPDEGLSKISPLFQRLFFETVGSVHIESSAPREYAITVPALHFRDPQTGGVIKYYFGSLFTQSLTGVVESLAGLEEDEAAGLDWTQICRRTQESIDDQFPDLCPRGVIPLSGGNTRIVQRSQTITAKVNNQPIRTRERP